jgi:hypothetical protein
VHLRAVDRDDLRVDQASPRAEPEHLAEQPRQHVLVALTKPRDRAVIGHPVRRDNAVGDILDAAALDAARGALPTCVRVEQQRDHHRRIVRRPPVTIVAVGGVERRQLPLLDAASTNHAK